MRKFIVIKTQFEATHKWEECDIQEVMYLHFRHRHIFHVTMKFSVTDNNREIEFIEQKHRVEDFIRQDWERKNLSNMSCERMAEILLDEFKASYVSVMEDNENGAEVYKEDIL
jgi:hypothetical protein